MRRRRRRRSKQKLHEGWPLSLSSVLLECLLGRRAKPEEEEEEVRRKQTKVAQRLASFSLKCSTSVSPWSKSQACVGSKQKLHKVMVQRNMQGHSRFMSHGVGHLEAYNLDGSIDVPLEGGYTALHLTCMLGFLPCVQLLLERGANLEVASGLLRMFPLHSACKGGSTEVVEFLINTVPYSEVVKRILNTGDKDGDTVPAVLAWPETEVRRFLDEAAAAAASASNSH
ncbi:ankyrin repeat domain-containing protein 1-like isoform X2 [Amborella trichopoda]|uniref:ankyrin repeat domain-containing protein 1-like isoform X2 n=1 Tax=Amborella trichopoda TaxID=13333 RepID=UPI0009BD7BC2|nr:ankyrin repeat domain-containing protein 1-like isoform X2 [Amborella trichopoda]|eukprot:XP_020519513.1 ankyrin repeat domain-containing protein 1-like isoform X2 [Amborella trichopoda]